MNGSNTPNAGRPQLLEPYWVNMYPHVNGTGHVSGTRHFARERAALFAGPNALYRVKVTPKRG